MQALQMSQAALAEAAPAQSGAASSTVPSGDMKKLLLSLKKDQDKLSPENQELVKTLVVKEEKQEEKELHQAVKKHSRARQDLREAYEARDALHLKWRTFLSLSVTQWQHFTKDFQSQEQAAVAQIQEAQSALKAAKAQLASSKEAIHTPKESKQEMEAQDLMSLVSEDEAPDVAGGQALQEGLQNLTTSLESLHQKAEVAFSEEQAAKKARLEGVADVSGLPGSGALQPFALPGTPRL